MQDRGNNLQNICCFNRLITRRPAAGESGWETVRTPLPGGFLSPGGSDTGMGRGKIKTKRKFLTERQNNIAISSKWVYNMTTCRAVRQPAE